MSPNRRQAGSGLIRREGTRENTFPAGLGDGFIFAFVAGASIFAGTVTATIRKLAAASGASAFVGSVVAVLRRLASAVGASVFAGSVDAEVTGSGDGLLLMGTEATALDPVTAVCPDAMWVVYAPTSDHRRYAVLLGRQ